MGSVLLLNDREVDCLVCCRCFTVTLVMNLTGLTIDSGAGFKTAKDHDSTTARTLVQGPHAQLTVNQASNSEKDSCDSEANGAISIKTHMASS